MEYCGNHRQCSPRGTKRNVLVSTYSMLQYSIEIICKFNISKVCFINFKDLEISIWEKAINFIFYVWKQQITKLKIFFTHDGNYNYSWGLNERWTFSSSVKRYFSLYLKPVNKSVYYLMHITQISHMELSNNIWTNLGQLYVWNLGNSGHSDYPHLHHHKSVFTLSRVNSLSNILERETARPNWSEFLKFKHFEK